MWEEREAGKIEASEFNKALTWVSINFETCDGGGVGEVLKSSDLVRVIWVKKKGGQNWSRESLIETKLSVSYNFNTCNGGGVEEVSKSRRAGESDVGRREHFERIQAEQDEAESCCC